VTPGVIQTAYSGGSGDGAVIKLASTGSRMWASYVGGTQYDLVMSVDAVGTTDVVLGGETQSAWVNFNNCAVSCGGSSNFCGFVSHLNANGTARIMSSILGGPSNFNSVLDVNADLSNNIYVTGFTNSTSYPVGGTVFQSTYGGGSSDAFLGTYNATSCWMIVLDRNELELSAEWQFDHAHLVWHAMETGEARNYVVERSWDGSNFASLGLVNGEGAAGLHSYAFSDSALGQNGNAHAWYRIRTEMPNGEVAYSEALLLASPDVQQELLVFPNPASQRIQVAGLSEEQEALYQVLDMDGRVVLQGTLTSTHSTIAVEAIPAGMYMLLTNLEGKQKVARIGIFH
jgi:hypothetical protein